MSDLIKGPSEDLVWKKIIDRTARDVELFRKAGLSAFGVVGRLSCKESNFEKQGKEYTISGLCQNCQDKVFGEEMEITEQITSPSGHYTLANYEQALIDAANSGQVVRLPEPDELLLDFDNAEDLAHYNRFVGWLLSDRFGWMWRTAEFPSKDPEHKHIYLQVPGMNFSEEERILLQLLLGSDRAREVYNLVRHRAGEKNATLLFEPPERDTRAYRDSSLDEDLAF